MKSSMKKFYVLLCTLVLLGSMRAYGDTINFEGLSDGSNVGTYYSGVVFTNATILTAGLSLNELEFPPKSGQNVASDGGGPIGISFTTQISSFSGYFTYAEPLTISAYDASGNFLGSTASLFNGNYTSSGNPTNELLGLSFAQNIGSVLLTGDPGGGSFVVDDITYTPVSGTPPPPPPPPVTVTPEPSGLLLLCTGILSLGALQYVRLKQTTKVYGLSRS